ncbi:uncharacterized protein I206_102068 [Kwoniella pini CBS 10737]|uniref:Uncharacterized protein n=1 Tax=Kwoniella pini CBS 10737 TaxID=1296096 RepID=A0A1B9HUW5_9TREE|nr:uncharacterized protein I206_06839 [Kwoniella pini CBS 10737]OCF47065.1 hypothetical protein I206_06839 [Kwoniella pini CBS 10737]
MVRTIREPNATTPHALRVSTSSATSSRQISGQSPSQPIFMRTKPSYNSSPHLTDGGTLKKRTVLGERVENVIINLPHLSTVKSKSKLQARSKPSLIPKATHTGLARFVAKSPLPTSNNMIPSSSPIYDSPNSSFLSKPGSTPYLPRHSIPLQNNEDDTLLLNMRPPDMDITDESDVEGPRGGVLGRGGLMTPANSQEVSFGSPQRVVQAKQPAASSGTMRYTGSRLPTPPSSQLGSCPTAHPPTPQAGPSKSRVRARPSPTPPRRISADPSQVMNLGDVTAEWDTPLRLGDDISPNPRRKKSPRISQPGQTPTKAKSRSPEVRSIVEVVIPLRARSKTPSKTAESNTPATAKPKKGRVSTRTPNSAVTQLSGSIEKRSSSGGSTTRRSIDQSHKAQTPAPNRLARSSSKVPSTAPSKSSRRKSTISLGSKNPRKRSSPTSQSASSRRSSLPSDTYANTRTPAPKARGRKSLAALIQTPKDIALSGRKLGTLPRPIHGSPGEDPLLLKATKSQRKIRGLRDGQGLALDLDDDSSSSSDTISKVAESHKDIPESSPLRIPENDLTLLAMSSNGYMDLGGAWSDDGSDMDVGDDTFIHVRQRKENSRSLSRLGESVLEESEEDFEDQRGDAVTEVLHHSPLLPSRSAIRSSSPPSPPEQNEQTISNVEQAESVSLPEVTPPHVKPVASSTEVNTMEETGDETEDIQPEDWDISEESIAVPFDHTRDIHPGKFASEEAINSTQELHEHQSTAPAYNTVVDRDSSLINQSDKTISRIAASQVKEHVSVEATKGLSAAVEVPQEVNDHSHIFTSSTGLTLDDYAETDEGDVTQEIVQEDWEVSQEDIQSSGETDFLAPNNLEEEESLSLVEPGLIESKILDDRTVHEGDDIQDNVVGDSEIVQHEKEIQEEPLPLSSPLPQADDEEENQNQLEPVTKTIQDIEPDLDARTTTQEDHHKNFASSLDDIPRVLPPLVPSTCDEITHDAEAEGSSLQSLTYEIMTEYDSRSPSRTSSSHTPQLSESEEIGDITQDMDTLDWEVSEEDIQPQIEELDVNVRSLAQTEENVSSVGPLLPGQEREDSGVQPEQDARKVDPAQMKHSHPLESADNQSGMGLSYNSDEILDDTIEYTGDVENADIDTSVASPAQEDHEQRYHHEEDPTDSGKDDQVPPVDRSHGNSQQENDIGDAIEPEMSRSIENNESNDSTTPTIPSITLPVEGHNDNDDEITSQPSRSDRTPSPAPRIDSVGRSTTPLFSPPASTKKPFVLIHHRGDLTFTPQPSFSYTPVRSPSPLPPPTPVFTAEERGYKVLEEADRALRRLSKLRSLSPLPSTAESSAFSTFSVLPWISDRPAPEENVYHDTSASKETKGEYDASTSSNVNEEDDEPQRAEEEESTAEDVTVEVENSAWDITAEEYEVPLKLGADDNQDFGNDQDANLAESQHDMEEEEEDVQAEEQHDSPEPIEVPERIVLKLVEKGIIKLEPESDSEEVDTEGVPLETEQSTSIQDNPLAFDQASSSSPLKTHSPLPAVLAGPSTPSIYPTLPPAESSTPKIAPPPALRYGPNEVSTSTSHRNLGSERLLHDPKYKSKLSKEVVPSSSPSDMPITSSPESSSTDQSIQSNNHHDLVDEEQDQSIIVRKPRRSLYDELTAVATEAEESFEGDQSFKSVVEVSSLDPKAAARAAAILKLNHAYIEHGQLSKSSSKVLAISSSSRRSVIEIEKEEEKRELLHEAELEIVESHRRSRSRSRSMSRLPLPQSTPVSGLNRQREMSVMSFMTEDYPVPGAFVETPKSIKRKRMVSTHSQQGSSREEASDRNHTGKENWSVNEWKKLEKVYRQEKESWLKERDIKNLPGGLVGWARRSTFKNSTSKPVIDWDLKKVVEKFSEDESALGKSWDKDMLLLRVQAIEKRVSKLASSTATTLSSAEIQTPLSKRAKTNATPSAEFTTSLDTPGGNKTTSTIEPPSTIRRMISFVWGKPKNKEQNQTKGNFLNKLEKSNADTSKTTLRAISVENPKGKTKEILPISHDMREISITQSRPLHHPASSQLTPIPPPPSRSITSNFIQPSSSKTKDKMSIMTSTSLPSNINDYKGKLYPPLNPPISQRSNALSKLFSTNPLSDSNFEKNSKDLQIQKKGNGSVKSLVENFENKGIIGTSTKK